MSDPIKHHDLSIDPTRGLSAADDLNVTLCDWAWRHGLPLWHTDVDVANGVLGILRVRLGGLVLSDGRIVAIGDEDDE